MSVTGLCQICSTRTAERRCDSCGALACLHDYEESAGVCVQCTGTRRFTDSTPDQSDTNRFP